MTHTGTTIRRVCALAALTAAATLGAAGSAPAATKWLCGPGVAHDPCRPSLSTTFYRGWDARAGSSTPRRDRDQGVACFYVYPTVSNQQSRLATKRVDPEIRSIALYQAARFSQVCRVYAPVYRQATVPALQAGTTTRRDYLTAYSDVENAFDAFLRRIGRHRGFVLIGHSQGSYHLERLIRRRIDNHRALRRRMVSAVLLGGNVSVREKSDRGGTFRRVPTCRRATQLSCVLAFSTFNETPPDAAVFGRGASRVASFLGLPDRLQARDRLHEPGRPRQQPIGPVGLGRSDAAVRPRDTDRRGNLAARAPMAGCFNDVRAEQRGLHRPLLPGGRRTRAADRLCPRHAGSEGVSDAGMGPAPRRCQHRPGRPREGPAEPDPRIRSPLTSCS